MGRAFEYRRAKKEKRWGFMARTFTKIGKEITMAAKSGGSDPRSNTRLKIAMQNARGVNMPKDRVDAAIKRATSKDEADYQELVYEGYAPHGIALLVECATDNPTRTVANVRLIFNKGGGSLGNTGTVEFMFDRKAIFKISAENVSKDDLELELIDFGLEEIEQEENEIFIYTAYSDFNTMQKALEDKNVNIITSELTRIPNSFNPISDEDREKVEAMIEKLEDDEDVSNVYHNME